MDDLIRQAVVALRGMWQRRWIGLAAAWIVAIAGTIAVLRIPDKYEASARIYVDTQSVLKPLLAGIAIQPNIDQQVMILSRTLISRPNIEKLVRMADLDLGTQSKREQEAMIDELMKTLAIQTTGRDNLYTLSYRSTQPDKAKRVVQSLVSIFVESSLGGKRKDSDSAKKFIDDQIKNYEKKLEEAEGRLKDFKLRNLALTTADGKDYYGRVGDISTQLSQARLELREAENSRDALKRQILGEEPVLLPDSAPDSAAGASVPEIDGRIEVLKKNLDTILLRYTDQHPDVAATKRVIADLEEQKRQILAARAKAVKPGAPAATSINSNPVYQQLKVSLAESEATVAALQHAGGRIRDTLRAAQGFGEARAAGRGRVRAAEPRLRHQQEELRKPRRPSRIRRDRRRHGGVRGRRGFPPDRSAAGIGTAGRPEPPGAAAARVARRAGRRPLREFCRQPGLADVPRRAFAARCDRRSGAGVRVDDGERCVEAQGAARADRLRRRHRRLAGVLRRRTVCAFHAVAARHQLSPMP